jgi:hypothetical protein
MTTKAMPTRRRRRVVAQRSKGTAGGEREQQRRERVVGLAPEDEVGEDGRDDRPAKRAQRALAHERDDAGAGDGQRDRMCEQQQVGDVLGARLLGRACRRVQEEVDARPAVRRLPEEIGNEQQPGEEERHRESGGAEQGAVPDQEARREQHQHDGKRVLRLEADAGGDAEHPPGAPPERETNCEPENDHRGQLVERDRLEQTVRRDQQR